ncbi:MAG: UvrD-helicase domain-containing protein [Tannerellaceae bacterium]|nr:UvrD-helicase domain-containing protein [Tannerellaceae bacterium]
MEDYLNQLNENQRQAVVYTDGPQLVIAGAGSGKTRVLTYKIAYLLHKGWPPQSILALTFTNKAAREMKERIAAITETSIARRLWMGTFHALFSRILRSEADRIGFPAHFTIYDSADSKSLLRSIIKEMQLDDKVYHAGTVQNRISKAKNALVTWSAYEKNRELVESDMHSRMPLIRDIYKRYQKRCLQAGAMDFDDLLLHTYLLFCDHPDVLDKYRGFFQYILVDEYQDTNFAQHMIIQQLAGSHRHICVVGDDAQSIYSFRGANIDNMLKFKEVYPECSIFKLERNYRSTQNIVNAANSLIYKNEEQIPKTIYSEKEPGGKVRLFATYSDYEEAHLVVSKIQEMQREHKPYTFASFTVLYRTNAQSRILEEAFRKQNIPYKIYGGLSFYQRKEIKDILSYLRLIINPHDEEALKRVINYPARGIGDTTVKKLITAAVENNVSLWTVLGALQEFAVPVNKGTENKLAVFRELMTTLIVQETGLSAYEITMLTVEKSGISGDIFQNRTVEGISKQENLQELLKGISEFCDMRREEGVEKVTLADFLSEVSLLTDQDNEKDENTNKVTLMTVHAAKGLEFKNVFVVGLEEDLFPSIMSKDSPRAIEEERRLFYVAITRAEENCILTYAKSRFRNGQNNYCSPSRFLKDIAIEFLDRGGTKQAVNLFSSTTSTTSTPVAVDPDPSGLKVGVKVQHDRFGVGVVTAIEGNGGDTRAIVQFVHSGEKRLLLKFARLTIVKRPSD